MRLWLDGVDRPGKLMNITAVRSSNQRIAGQGRIFSTIWPTPAESQAW
ncbi:hypothetical protein [uncultured Mycobacterium sp.]